MDKHLLTELNIEQLTAHNTGFASGGLLFKRKIITFKKL